MLLFLFAVFLLLCGYLIYGTFVSKIFKIDPKRPTPAIALCDNIDFMPLSDWKVFLIQFLNIAGLGPVFGAILGALYGPVALLWIVFGSILAGGVHDYMAGMMSVRENGCSPVYLVEKYMGKKTKWIFLSFMIGFLLLLGAVFAMSPAHMLSSLSGFAFHWWLVAIFGYYFLATLLPIDKIIGRFYPLFALLLISVTLAMIIVLFTNNTTFYPQLNFTNQHPEQLPIFPLMFVTIACGALSGFHATQSPLMARCINNECKGRAIFYGAMITEGIVALIWATLGIAFYQGSDGLLAAIKVVGPGGVVAEISKNYLGEIGGILAVMSVIILSVTSGDTAFRSARLTVSDYLLTTKKSFLNRIIISILILSGGVALSFFDLTVIWTYFGWANQCLATIVLWTASFYLLRNHKFYWITLLPGGFMTAVCTTYILYDKIGFSLPITTSTYIGCAFACICLLMFIGYAQKTTKKSGAKITHAQQKKS